MQAAEEFRYLVLAAQRERNRILTETLRPLELTPSQAEVLRVLQEHQPLSLIALGDLRERQSESAGQRAGRGRSRQTCAISHERSDGDTDADRPRGRDGYSCERCGGSALRVHHQDLEGHSLSDGIALLWRLVEGRPAGEALARRIRCAHEASEA